MNKHPDGQINDATVESPCLETEKSSIRESIVNATEQLMNSDKSPQNVSLLMAAVKDLLEGLAVGDLERAEDALIRLGSRSDRDLFQEVGSLTRGLHQSISDFKNSLDPKIKNIVVSGVPDATDKLQSVIQMTEEAAHKTLAALEAQRGVIDESDQQIEMLEQLLAVQQSSPVAQSLIDHSRRFLEAQKQRNLFLNQRNMEALMAQSFQDLSGQSLKKVIHLVTEIEESLVNMIRIFGVKLNDNVSVATAESAPISEQLGGQDDIDDLLKGFGF